MTGVYCTHVLKHVTGSHFEFAANCPFFSDMRLVQYADLISRKRGTKLALSNLMFDGKC